MKGFLDRWNTRYPYLTVTTEMIKRVAVFVVIILAIVAFAAFVPDEVVRPINSFAWVFGNMLMAYSGIVLVGFLILYYILFDPSATTGGKLVFRFMLSLAGVIFLVFLGVFIDPGPDRQWYAYPENVEDWRPLLRLVIYGYVAFAITELSRLLILRKWFPGKVRKASDLELVKPRHTGEIKLPRKSPSRSTTTTVPTLMGEESAGPAGDSGASSE